MKKFPNNNNNNKKKKTFSQTQTPQQNNKNKQHALTIIEKDGPARMFLNSAKSEVWLAALCQLLCRTSTPCLLRVSSS
jgi:hypothetical protein